MIQLYKKLYIFLKIILLVELKIKIAFLIMIINYNSLRTK